MEKLKFIAFALVAMLATFMVTSCSKDDENDTSGSGALIGTWVLEDYSEEYDYSQTVKMTLTFRSNNTGSIVEDWITNTRATEINKYAMDFYWSITSDANGNDIMRVSYVSGDKNTELFYGDSNTALWTSQYVVTGNILNVYTDGGVWVFHKK